MKLAGWIACVFLGGVALAQGWVDRSVANGPAPRRDHAMCYDPIRNYVLMVGGRNPITSYYMPETWSWDGTSWTSRGSAPADMTAIVHHAGAAKVLGFAYPSNLGNSAGQVQCYEWDGSNWVNQTAIPLSPTSGLGAVTVAFLACYDPIRNEVVVLASDNLLGTTYWGNFQSVAVFDGATWRTAAQLSGVYPARNLGWDPTVGRLVIGYNDTGLVLAGSAWTYRDVTRYAEWSGLGWAPRFAQNGPSRCGPMATDAGRGVLLQFDSTYPGSQIPGTNVHCHTWSISSANCDQLITANTPPMRIGSAMAFDTLRNATVLFGGWNQFNSPMGDTWELTLGAPATFTGYGTGCPGSRGVPQLFAINNDIPRTGSLFETQVNNLPWNAPTFLLFGLSNTNSAGLPLPFDLTVAGAPGCTLLTSIDNIIPLTNVLGSAVWSLQMPHLPGASFYLQAVPFEASANSLGVALSNGGHGLLGL